MATPRYVRVNVLETTDNLIEKAFVSEGYKKVNPGKMSAVPEEKTFWRDRHIPHLLVFPPGTDFHDHVLVESGKCILQDKASCFPATILQCPPGARAIDCAAAPGNKTTHMAATMRGRGQIDAFEINVRRHELLQTRVAGAGGSTCINTHQQSFLDVDWSDKRWEGVTHILLDPTCSGSGMVQRLDYYGKTLIEGAADPDTKVAKAKEKSRVKELSNFQRTMLSHALSCPTVERLTYSTCSIHKEENEEVVKDILEAFPAFTLERALPSWPRRGLSDACPNGDYCVRATPGDDKTNGFFVALFVRRKGAEGKKAPVRLYLPPPTPSAEERQQMREKRKMESEKRKAERESAAPAPVKKQKQEPKTGVVVAPKIWAGGKKKKGKKKPIVSFRRM